METLREKQAKKQFTITVEINPPKSASPDKAVNQAKELAGKVDAINIADCPMSNMRMSSIAIASIVKNQTNTDTIFHFTCRDRNSIGIQSELLGAAALGVENILTLGGDKPDRGDHPFATSVFELDSMKLIHLAKTLNSGKDLAGNALDVPTHFYVGTTGNPGADDYSVEAAKLKAKIEAGADFVQTQPVYDLELAKRYMDMASQFGKPIMLGLIPLKSYKMALYLHNHVPGITLSDTILTRMEKGGKEAGREIACELLEGLTTIADGVHIMPVNDFETAVYLVNQVR